MKITKTANGKNRIKISKREWESIGEKYGWFKQAAGLFYSDETNMTGQDNADALAKIKQKVKYDLGLEVAPVITGELFEKWRDNGKNRYMDYSTGSKGGDYIGPLPYIVTEYNDSKGSPAGESGVAIRWDKERGESLKGSIESAQEAKKAKENKVNPEFPPPQKGEVKNVDFWEGLKNKLEGREWDDSTGEYIDI